MHPLKHYHLYRWGKYWIYSQQNKFQLVLVLRNKYVMFLLYMMNIKRAHKKTHCTTVYSTLNITPSTAICTWHTSWESSINRVSICFICNNGEMKQLIIPTMCKWSNRMQQYYIIELMYSIANLFCQIYIKQQLLIWSNSFVDMQTCTLWSTAIVRSFACIYLYLQLWCTAAEFS